MSKKIIYQVLPRLFGQLNGNVIVGGSIEENGSGKLNTFDKNVLKYFRDMGITHMWYTGIIEHATATDYTTYDIIKDNPQVVKGKAGSPYAIKDYYDIDPDLAVNVPERITEFEELVQRNHEQGLKVIIDFVPNHLARQYVSDAKPEGTIDFGANDNIEHSFNPNNNFYYLPNQAFKAPIDSDDPWNEFPAKATGNDCFTAHPSVNDWYETVKLNYGVDVMNGRHKCFDPIPDTWFKMKSILMYWAKKGVDGFRCDMAEMVPVEFWQWCIREIKDHYPDLLFVAEVYNPQLYKTYIETGGFDLLYDKVGFYDSMIDVLKHHKSLNAISESWYKIDKQSDHMLFFLENHDEQRLASDFIVNDGKKAWPAWVITALYSSNALMLYSGQELGERGMDEEGFSGRDGRTTIFDYWAVESFKRYMSYILGNNQSLLADEVWLLEHYTRLNILIRKNKVLNEGGVYDLLWCNSHSGGLKEQRIYAWLRYNSEQWMLLVANLSDAEADCRIIIPQHAFISLGIDHMHYFKGKEILESERSIQFPKDVAITRGVGLKVKTGQALVYLFE